MCGIAGVLSWGSAFHEDVDEMVAALEHRGPDASGFWGKGPYRGGMRRLSINDPSGGHQPLFDETGRIVLFYNGEIYNSPALRSKMEGDGVNFKTRSDGEVICHLYRKYGKESFGLLDGMFAIALWDDEKKILILARDFPGEKPLYYGHITQGIAFASEITSLLKCRALSRDLDVQSLWDYPTFLWVPEPKTIYQDVHALMPGTGLIVSKRGRETFSFQDQLSAPDCEFDTDESAMSSVRNIVESSVKSRLLSDVSIGAFLSGGLDSSIICSIAKQELGELNTFCVGFENVSDPYHGYSDESNYAKEYARKLGSKHTTINVNANDFRQLLPKFSSAAGQPYAVSSGLGILAIAREAKEQGIKILLSGDGADEAFGGYSWYSKIPQTFYNRVKNDGIKARFLDLNESDEKRIQRMSNYDHSTRAWAWHYYASEEEKASIFHKDLVGDNSSRIFNSVTFREPLDYLKNDRQLYFPNEMLSKVDRMTMAYSVEGRSPFAAPSVQRFAAKLPWNKLIRDGQLKWVLRNAFKDYLPDEIVSRPKHGFNVPVDHWLKGQWRDLFEETFSSESALSKYGLLGPKSREHAIKLLLDPHKVSGHVLFSFVMLNIWMTQNEN